MSSSIGASEARESHRERFEMKERKRERKDQEFEREKERQGTSVQDTVYLKRIWENERERKGNAVEGRRRRRRRRRKEALKRGIRGGKEIRAAFTIEMKKDREKAKAQESDVLKHLRPTV